MILTGPASDPISSPVVLKLAGMPVVSEAHKIVPQEDGTVLLPAQKSIINNLNGSHTAYDAELMSIVNWKHDKASVDWDFKINTPGTYRITLLAASEKDSRIRISVGKKNRKPTMPATGGFGNFQPFDAGKIRIDKAGDVTIHFEPVRKEWAPINIQSVELALEK